MLHNEMSDIWFAGGATAGAWVAAIGTVVSEGGAAAGLSIAFSAGLTLLWGAQRKQRKILVETIEQASKDRDECRKELHELKEWIALNFEYQPHKDPNHG